jgi:hypothetical protein
MNMYCDRYSVCQSMLPTLDRDQDTEAYARAKGWHIWRGLTQDGRESEVILCNKCVASHRRNLAPAPDLLPNQYPIPQLEIVRPEGLATQGGEGKVAT